MATLMTGNINHGYRATMLMFCASLSSTPQLVIGGRNPSPRKDSAVSPRIMLGITNVADAIK